MGSTNTGPDGSLTVQPNPDRVWDRVTFSGAPVNSVVVTDDKLKTTIDGNWDPHTQTWRPTYPRDSLGRELTVKVTQKSGPPLKNVNAHFTAQKLAAPPSLLRPPS